MMAMLGACHKGMMACLGKTEADTEKPDPDSGMMQSTKEHQEFTKKDAAVIPVKGRKKRHRERKPAAGPNELTRGDCGSGKKLAAACRKVSRRARVRWRKRNVVRKIVTKGNYGPSKTLTVEGRRTTSRATVAWQSENVVRKDCVRDQTEQETAKGRKDGGLWNGRKCNSGIKDHRTRQQLRLGNEKTTSMIYRKAIRLEIVKRTLRISSVVRKIRKWTLWRGRPPPKRKKR
jgi:hypothetical protein